MAAPFRPFNLVDAFTIGPKRHCTPLPRFQKKVYTRSYTYGNMTAFPNLRFQFHQMFMWSFELGYLYFINKTAKF